MRQSTCTRCASNDWQTIGQGMDGLQPVRHLRCKVCGNIRNKLICVPNPQVEPGPACGVKRVYATKKEAQSAINYRKKSRLNTPTFLRSYYCESCGGWHLTHRRLSQFIINNPSK